MHYARTLTETHEAEFLRFAKLGRDARPLEMDPADVYELVQLDRHTDRILPNGVCLLPPQPGAAEIVVNQADVTAQPQPGRQEPEVVLAGDPGPGWR